MLHYNMIKDHAKMWQDRLLQ